MDRLDILRQHIAKQQLGVEIGPYFSPLVPKRSGYQSLTLDVFDAAELRRRAKADPNIARLAIRRIEPVDLLGTGAEIARLVDERGLGGRIDYVISSHNFEHLPDPIRFLQGCAQILRPGGIVVMAIPDRRCTFDYFRPHSVTGDLLAAYFERRERPTAAQVFIGRSLDARWRQDGEEMLAFSLAHDPARVVPDDHLSEAYQGWQGLQAAPDEIYRDVHCWAFTPASFELIVRDLRFLGLVELDLDAVQGPSGCEFFVRLSKPPAGAAPAANGDYAAQRAELLHRINSEASVNARAPDIGEGDDVAVLKSRVAALQGRTNELDAELRAMRGSQSWRLTSPLRLVARVLRRLR